MISIKLNRAKVIIKDPKNKNDPKNKKEAGVNFERKLFHWT